MSSPRYQGTEPVETLPRPSPAPRQHDTPWAVSWCLSLAATGQRGRGGLERQRPRRSEPFAASCCVWCMCMCSGSGCSRMSGQTTRPPPACVSGHRDRHCSSSSSSSTSLTLVRTEQALPPRSHRTNPRAQFELRLVKLGGPWPDLGFFSGFRFELSQPVASQSRLDQLGSPALLSDCSESLPRGHVRQVSWQRDRTLFLLPIWTHDKDWSVIGTVGTSVGQFSSSRRRRLARLCSWPIQHAPWSFFPLDAARRYAAQVRPPSSSSSSSSPSSSFLDACAKQPGYSRAKGSLDETHIHHHQTKEKPWYPRPRTTAPVPVTAGDVITPTVPPTRRISNSRATSGASTRRPLTTLTPDPPP